MSDSFLAPRAVARQAPLFMGFPRQEYWSGLPFPFLENLSDLVIEPRSPALAGRFVTTETPGKPYFHILTCLSGLPWWLSGKESACQHRRSRFNPWVRTISWRWKWPLTPVFLSGKSHGQRSRVGYSLQGCKRVRYDLATEKNNI